MTNAALARLRTELTPSIVYIPTRRGGSWDSPQRSSDRYVGYRALWMKVIIRAAFDWVSYRDALKLEQRKEAERAHRWIFERNEHFNSFENICQLVDLPPDKIRVWVKSLTKEHVAKIEHLERESLAPIALLEAERRLIEDIIEDDEDA
jgi:hypothetical protein